MPLVRRIATTKTVAVLDPERGPCYSKNVRQNQPRRMWAYLHSPSFVLYSCSIVRPMPSRFCQVHKGGLVAYTTTRAFFAPGKSHSWRQAQWESYGGPDTWWRGKWILRGADAIENGSGLLMLRNNNSTWFYSNASLDVNYRLDHWDLHGFEAVSFLLLA